MSRATIVGIGATKQGELPGLHANEIAGQALEIALADSGIGKSQIDGLITCKSVRGDGVDTEVGRLLGISPNYSATLSYGSCNFSIHLAAMAIQAGLATTVALTYGTDVRAKRHKFGGGGERSISAPYGFFHISGAAALALRRHQHLYGTTEEQFANIALNQRANAALNPLAVFREPLSMEQYLAAPYLVQPLRRFDVTMVSDGGVALVMTSADRAKDFPNRPVHLIGMAETTALQDLQAEDHYLRPWIGDVAERLYASADLGPDDIDALYIQDPTAVWVLQMLEWYGFCKVGEAGPMLAEGHTKLNGRLPVNSNGGQLSESYMWGWLHVYELVRQLRGTAEPQRQIPNARTAMYCSTMAFQKAAASIFQARA